MFMLLSVLANNLLYEKQNKTYLIKNLSSCALRCHFYSSGFRSHHIFPQQEIKTKKKIHTQFTHKHTKQKCTQTDFWRRNFTKRQQSNCQVKIIK